MSRYPTFLSRYLICATSTLLLALLPAAATAQPAAGARPGQAQPRKADTPKPAAKAAPSSAREPYGPWQSGWGARPPAPPRHWTNKGDWHRHVRACQQRYRSYNPRTDSYRLKSGGSRRCTL